jgi:uncharacterized phiE125 gp8 family phage protein
MVPLVITHDCVCWWRGKAACRFWAGQYAWVSAPIARFLFAQHFAHYFMKGHDMSTSFAHAIERITPPASEPVTLAEAKNYLRVEHANDDAMIALMITAAREAAEAYLGTSFITQRWKMTLENELPCIVPLRFGLAQSIVSIVEKTEVGGSTTIDPAGYRLSIDKRAAHVLSSRIGFRFEITYDAGYGASAALMPGLIRQGVLQHVATMYEVREMSSPIPAMALQAYHPYKEISL